MLQPYLHAIGVIRLKFFLRHLLRDPVKVNVVSQVKHLT